MAREVRWERMFPDELEAAFEACPVVYMPYGLCEPHGPQNALGMDGLRAHACSCRAAHRYGGIVAPPTFWNVHELGIYAAWAHPRIGQARPWLTALPPWVFFKDLCYHVRAADALGFQAIVVFSGHGGPHGHDFRTLTELLQPHFAGRLALLTDADLIRSTSCGHADKVETSMLWAAEPDCVDISRLPAPDDPGPHFAMGSNAYESDRRLGEALVAEVAENLGTVAQELLEAYREPPAGRQALTYDDIERIWEEDVRPRVPEFRSMQDLSEGQEPPPEDSRWWLQWRVPRRA
ncbi:MAG: creatininase family protein [Armatimonadota bacterium]